VTARAVSLREGLHAELARLVEADAPAVLAYFDRVTGETDFAPFGPGEYPRNIEEEGAKLHGLAENPSQGVALGARIAGELAGIATITALRAPRVRHNGTLGVSVLQKYWGVGLGRALCEQAILEARGIGLSRIELHTRQDNHRAIALYEDLGFQHEGRLRGAFLRGAFRVGPVEYDDLVMALRLHA
jgi:RimJ/RimL family protein N-acetyltransferase